jgi:glycosyltransferase involved in cell wall biosynthesis
MNEPLAIALLSHTASQRAPTGAEHSLALLAEGLSGRGHRVTVVAPGNWALEPALRRSGVEVATIPGRACWLTYYAPRPWPVFVLKWLRWAWPDRSTARITAYLEHWRPDVVHVNCLPHLRGAAAAASLGRPVVWHVREILPPGPRRKWLARRLARHATIVVAVSEAVGQWLRAEGLEAGLRVVPNGVALSPTYDDGTLARRKLDLPADGVLFGLFGQLVPHKGALPFIEAARRALAAEPSLRFVLAGAGPESFLRRVREAIAGTARAERFHLLPPQPSSAALIAASDVVCVTTITPDPLPRVVLEAMAAARPVAAFNSGGTAEMVDGGATGLLVPPGDAAALGEAFARLGRDATLRRTMGQAGADRARQLFSLEQHLDRMEEVFRSVNR